MASLHSFLLFLSFVLAHLSSFVSAAPWIVTAYYQEDVYTREGYYTTYTTTRIEQITPTVTSLPPAQSTITSVANHLDYNGYGSYYENNDVTVIEQLYPTGVGSDYYDYLYEDNDGDVTTMFVVNLTYTAPTGCSSQWTTTTTAEITPPARVQSLLPLTAVETSFSVDDSRPFQPTTYTVDVVYVDPTQVPSSSLESLSLYNRPTSLYTGDNCYYTASSGAQYGSGSYSNGYSSGYYNDWDDNYNWFLDNYYMGISPLALTLILSLGWIGLFLILGFIEAWIRFRRLMTGWQTRRGLPVCWSLTILPITLILLCWFRRGYRARSQADGEVLQKRWKAMSIWTKLRLFFVWGFRFKYPPMLGPAPARVKTSKQPERTPGPRLLEPSPASSVAPQSRQGSTAQPGGDVAAPAATADPEMAEASHLAPVASQPQSGPAHTTHQDDEIRHAR
ncbi:uncharacterized protein BO97DRAFT_402017 [Aspergillus homomorphus CBS 101889]|uniref:Uncharacterized protein n=1 Tax=Aspergillus homomorphus (strain CBS 101889) TaxID=1450537 RepID=A0A395IB36_ASPHC|nr:hypothetical protein BO97DRAFT_402017 [Aspergillus homomorphus CBS 101889]RAL17407.1 hypothetical protein BO97DRAFT_402017 [Aspergillus homomorphus CBS 101889]